MFLHPLKDFGRTTESVDKDSVIFLYAMHAHLDDLPQFDREAKAYLQFID